MLKLKPLNLKINILFIFQEESEMKRDGTLSTLRPSQMSVARITVVRGYVSRIIFLFITK